MSTVELILTSSVAANSVKFLSWLSSQLFAHFELSENLKYLEGAIRILERTIQLTQDGHNLRPFYCSNLCAMFNIRFQRAGVPENFESAVFYGQQAVLLALDDNNTGKLPCLINLGDALKIRY